MGYGPVTTQKLSLDVVVTTYNRAPLLAKAIQALLAAEVPPHVTVRISIVDNASKDDTRRVVEKMAAGAPIPISYIYENRQGHAHALNAGVASGNGDLVGLTDDDEQIDKNWYKAAAAAFADVTVDFIGGPYVPVWAAPPPDWLPRQKAGVLGWIDYSPVPTDFKDLPNATLCSGNAVMRRDLMRRMGPYRTDVQAHHDTEMFNRFMKARARGVYIPSLIIYHHIPADRMTKAYFRRWVQRAAPVYARLEDGPPARSIAGVPLYVIRKCATSAAKLATSLFHPAKRFEAELDLRYALAFAAESARLASVQPQEKTPIR